MEHDKREAHLKQTIWKLAYAKRAVVHIRAACDGYERCVDGPDHPLHVPIMCAIAVTYSRPFTNNNGVGMISEKLRRYSDPSLQRTHDDLWTHRNFLSAHSDASILIRDSAASKPRPQDIQIMVTRQRTPAGDLLSFHQGFHEMKLIGVKISDVRRLCDEFERRLDKEMQVTMSHLYADKGLEIIKALNQAGSDSLTFPLGFVPVTPKRGSREH